MRTRSLICSTVFIASLSLGCGGTDLTKYRCTKAITGASESGGVIASAGSIAYVGGAGTIAVFDLSSPADPKVLAPVPFPYPVVGLAVSGSTLVAVSGQSLAVYDVSNPAAPVKRSELASGAPSSVALATDGHWAYSGTVGANIAVYDLSGVAPKLVTQVSAGQEAATSLILNGSALYVGGTLPKALAIFDVSSPAQPVVQAAVDVNGFIEGMTSDEGALFAVTLQPLSDLHAQRFGLGSPMSPRLEATSGEVGGGHTPGTLQVSALQGYFLASGGIAVGGWKESDIPAQSIQIGPVCLPEQFKLQHVHAVGDAIVTSGQEGIGFLAP